MILSAKEIPKRIYQPTDAYKAQRTVSPRARTYRCSALFKSSVAIHQLCERIKKTFCDSLNSFFVNLIVASSGIDLFCAPYTAKSAKNPSEIRSGANCKCILLLNKNAKKEQKSTTNGSKKLSFLLFLTTKTAT